MNRPPSNDQPRILIVDDNAAIHEDFRKILGGRAAAGTRLGEAEAALFGGVVSPTVRTGFRIDSALQGQEALALVEQALRENDPYVLAFVDVRMPPGWDGVETLERVWRCCPELQAVICTAYSDYSWDDFARRLGQADNLLILKKPFETVEVLQLAHALTKKWALTRQAELHLEDLDRMVCERTHELVAANEKLRQEMAARAQIQEALHISEERFSKAFQASPMPMAIQSCPAGRFLDANPSFLELAGRAADQLLKHTGDELRLWENGTDQNAVTFHPEKSIRNHSCLLRRGDGTTRNTVLWAEPITLGSEPCLLVVLEDVTEELKLEAQLRQAQKMEAVGRLSAGIAHEFNNILTIIQGHAGLLRDKPAAKSAGESVERIAQASQRAASLTRQLLAFSRKQTLQPKAINLSTIVQDTRKMLGQLIGERHTLKLDCAENLPCIHADEGNVEQVLINLTLNARDAMPDGGVIRVTTSLANIDEAAAHANVGARAGRFVCLTVSDAGCGMDQEILSHIFDPFFTTKDVGKGTGLGLSTIHGIVQQHRGWVEVASQVGHGTTFKVFLPICEGLPAPTPLPGVARDAASGRGAGETVLLVEDESTVRELARLALERGGYQVFEAEDGHQAMQVWEKRSTGIALLMTDMVMPNGISGAALAKTLQAKDPGLRVLYTSGYSSEVVREELHVKNGANFLPKPYDTRVLLETIKLCLNGNTHASCQLPAEPEVAAR